MKNTSTKAAEAEKLFLRAEAMYDSGRLRSAFRLTKAAAQLGSDAAMVNLGNLYDAGTGTRRNRNMAMYWYKKAYRRGSETAANNIGIVYRNEQKFRRALAWLEKAVALGNGDANIEIARLYLGPLNDAKAAFRHLKQAAKAKPYAEVSEYSWELANRFLRRFQVIGS
jgi:uncharacterized protein